MRTRTLRLRRETLSELRPAAMRGVVGGTHLACGQTDNCTHRCLSLDRPCPSLQATCPSIPVTTCLEPSIDICAD